jgi:hypothetical protein
MDRCVCVNLQPNPGQWYLTKAAGWYLCMPARISPATVLAPQRHPPPTGEGRPERWEESACVHEGGSEPLS